jgi:hypothetical protein
MAAEVTATLVDEVTGEVVTVHPVADLFPLLPDDELADLAADITERGLLQPIVLDAEGRILDGRNRCRACWQAGVKPTFVDYEGDDPDGYALAVNITRRHMTKGQQAMVVARARSVSEQSVRSMAKATGVTSTRIANASTVLDHAPDLADAVVTGATSLDEAYKVARDRKRAADDTEAQMARLLAEAPDLAARVAEEQVSFGEALTLLRQREDDHKQAVHRDQERLRLYVRGRFTLCHLATNPDREEILAGLDDADRNAVMQGEAEHAAANRKRTTK